MNKKVLIVIGIIILIIMLLYYYVKDNYRYYGDKDYLIDISYDISDRFDASIYDSSRYYHYYEDDISCNFDISYFSTFDINNGEEYLRKRIMFTLNDEVSDIEEVDINNYKWYYMKVDSGDKISYYYATVKDDVGYELEYSISDYMRGDSNSSNKVCYSEYDRVISSIKFN
ncbi:MAG: hypothetical protein IJI49_00725 [Bacilli bacterium]|nr:hypothetical protein [Bacilli bacterium]